MKAEVNAGITVRDEHPSEADVVDALVGDAFGGRANEVELVRGLRACVPPARSRVAVEDGTVVGHAMVSALGLEGTDASVLGLAPVSVAPASQGHGVGSRLTDDALRVAEDCGAALVVVLGDPAYYRRFGFRPAAGYGIEAPPGVWADALMVVCLSSYDDALVGRVVYPRVFTETGTL
jgi:putative acetyltransferase